MKVPITVNDCTIEISVDDTIVRKVMAMAEKTSEKMTGYERHEHGQYYHQTTGGSVEMDDEVDHPLDQKRYQAGNYYSSKEVAENNARADRLMRNLRRFAAEHGGCGKPEIATHAVSECYTWTICCCEGELATRDILANIGTVNFKNKDTAQKAIDAFRDELLWYFTEYDPMPKGWWDE